MTTPRPGDQFAGTSLAQQLSAGPVSSTWRATRGGQQVLVKVVQADAIRDGMRFRTLLTEARRFVGLKAPQLAGLHSLTQEGGRWIGVSEFVEGRTLAQLLAELASRGVRPPRSVVIELALGAVRGLRAVHEARDARGGYLGLVHRDLRPAHVMLGLRGEVKLIDLGLAWANAGQTPELRAAGMGTPAYCPPEVWADSPLHQGADVFALGVLMWELAMGQRLFPGPTPRHLEAQIVRGSADGDAGRLQPVFPELAPLVAACLSRDPGRRAAELSELERALEGVRRPLAAPGGLGWFVSLLGGSGSLSGVDPSDLDDSWRRFLSGWMGPGALSGVQRATRSEALVEEPTAAWVPTPAERRQMEQARRAGPPMAGSPLDLDATLPGQGDAIDGPTPLKSPPSGLSLADTREPAGAAAGLSTGRYQAGPTGPNDAGLSTGRYEPGQSTGRYEPGVSTGRYQASPSTGSTGRYEPAGGDGLSTGRYQANGSTERYRPGLDQDATIDPATTAGQGAGAATAPHPHTHRPASYATPVAGARPTPVRDAPAQQPAAGQPAAMEGQPARGVQAWPGAPATPTSRSPRTGPQPPTPGAPAQEGGGSGLALARVGIPLGVVAVIGLMVVAMGALEENQQTGPVETPTPITLPTVAPPTQTPRPTAPPGRATPIPTLEPVATPTPDGSQPTPTPTAGGAISVAPTPLPEQELPSGPRLVLDRRPGFVMIGGMTRLEVTVREFECTPVLHYAPFYDGLGDWESLAMDRAEGQRYRIDFRIEAQPEFDYGIRYWIGCCTDLAPGASPEQASAATECPLSWRSQADPQRTRGQ